MSNSCGTCESTRMSKNGQCCSVYPMEESFTEKENQSFTSPRRKFDSDLSMYESNSPARMSCDGSPTHCSYTLRRPLEDHDHNSQDSGYSACESSRTSPKSKGLSFVSLISNDEEFLDISELEQENESNNLPGDFNKLITGTIKETKKSPEMVLARPTMRRALSMIASSNTPNSSRVRSCLFKMNEEVEIRNFKRPEPPTDLQSPVNTKRSRLFHEDQVIQRIPAKPLFQRSISSTEDSIKSALQRSTTDADLIGDFSKAFCLPLIPGRHQDLKSITPSTLAGIIRGDYSMVASFKIIDCRYPYEFEGGHIAGAQNFYTKQQVQEELLNLKTKNGQPETQEAQKRHIIVFHCEFSSERGPNLSRYLRNIDRSHNKDCYPSLHFPEVYLLDGGYKKFYESYGHLCAPNAYLPMSHPDYAKELRIFRAKSKTLNSDAKQKTTFRSSSFKRL